MDAISICSALRSGYPSPNVRLYETHISVLSIKRIVRDVMEASMHFAENSPDPFIIITASACLSSNLAL